MPVNYTDEEKQKAEAFFSNIPDAPSDALRGPETDEDDTEDHEETPTREAQPRPEAKPKATEEGDEAPAPKPRGTGKKVEAILEALRSGDEGVLGDLFDEDPSQWSETTQNAIKRRRALSRLKQERDFATGKAQEIVGKWKPVSDLCVAIDQQGNYAKVPELVEMLLGRKWEDIETNFRRAQRGLPAEAPKPPPSTELTEMAQADVPSDHQVRKLPGWEKGVAEVLMDNFDADLGESTISVAQAAARYLRRKKAEYHKLSEVLGSGGQTKREQPRTPALERVSSGGPAPGRKMTRDEFFDQFGK